MEMPDLKFIDNVRKKGYRPVVVGCFVDNNKILLVYKEKHQLWQLPQGGVENGENLVQAFTREMGEEMGALFVNKQEGEPRLVGSEVVEFRRDKWGGRELTDDNGKKILMRGKYYLFMKSASTSQDFDIEKSEFDKYEWVNKVQSTRYMAKIYQPGKRRITQRAIDSSVGSGLGVDGV